MSEALTAHDKGIVKFTAAVAYASGEVIQLPDLRAAVVLGLVAIAIGDQVCVATEGAFDVAAASGVTFAEGEAVYWDASANTAINLANVGAGDFFLGYAIRAKVSGQLVVRTDLNPVNKPHQQKTISAATTLAVSDLGSTIFANTQGGAFSVTLPPAANCAGRRLTFVRTGTGVNALTIDPNASEQVDGGATLATLDAARDTVTIESDGSNWFVIAARIA